MKNTTYAFFMRNTSNNTFMRNTLKRNESNALKCNVFTGNTLNAHFTKKYINCSLKTVHGSKLQNFIMAILPFKILHYQTFPQNILA